MPFHFSELLEPQRADIVARESQTAGKFLNRKPFLALRQFVIERRDIEDVFNDFNINVNPLEVAIWQVVPIPNCFSDALSGVTLLNSVVPHLTRFWFLFLAQFAVTPHGKEM